MRPHRALRAMFDRMPTEHGAAQPAPAQERAAAMDPEALPRKVLFLESPFRADGWREPASSIRAAEQRLFPAGRRGPRNRRTALPSCLRLEAAAVFPIWGSSPRSRFTPYIST